MFGYSHEKTFTTSTIIIISLLILNLVGIVIVICKPSALALETLKAGGTENYKMVTEILNSDAYKASQKAAIENSYNQLKAQTQQQVPAQMMPQDAPVTTGEITQ